MKVVPAARIHNPFDETPWVSCLRENLTSSSYGEGLETERGTSKPRQSLTRQLFFKWVKQHLKIKSFLGTSPNAVMAQVWVALCAYLLVAYLKFLTRVPWRPYELYKRLQAAALEYISLGQLLSVAPRNSRKSKQQHTQLNMLGRRVKALFVGR